MELWMGLYLVGFLDMARCLLESPYTVHLDKHSFENAQKYCQPGGFLTNIQNEKEMDKILKTVWDMSDKTTKSFWIGLKRDKAMCSQQHLPLKGFYWTVDNSTQSDVKTWKTEASSTCTSLRCGLLSVEYSDSGAKSSGFMDVSCKEEHPFICKRNVTLACPQPEILSTHDKIETTNDPYTRTIVCRSGASFNLTCTKDLVWTLVGDQNADISQLCLECKIGYRRDKSGNCVDVNECDEIKPCKHKCENTEGSYKCLCSYNDDGICNGPSKPPTTNLKSNEINKSKSVLTQPTSQPDDVRMNETSVHIVDSAGDISNIVVPVIIALLIFIVLLVIVAAIVKGCLRRRSIKLARRKAEAVALNGSSSMEKVNEKEET